MIQPTYLTEIMAKIGLKEWFSSLSERDKVRMERYAAGSDTSSAYAFLLTAGSSALNEENHQFASTVLEECLKMADSDIKKFDASESLIESYVGAKRYDEAKQQCRNNLSLYPNISDILIKRNNGLPEKMSCRNRYIDIIVGIESGYDEAFEMLDRFLEMGLITEEDHRYRKQSLKIHRLQRSFDGVYTYSYKN